MRLQMLGYELTPGKHGQPEIRGYTKEYLEAPSPRREQIKDHLCEQGIDGAAAAQVAAHHTRDRKELLSRAQVLQRHRDLAAQFGYQADRVVETGIPRGKYAQVRSIDAASNRLTVRLQDGAERTYDPRRQRGVSVFREEIRRFSVGDRIQFTAPANDLKIANRELGVIKCIDEAGRLSLRMDSGRRLAIDPN